MAGILLLRCLAREAMRGSVIVSCQNPPDQVSLENLEVLCHHGGKRNGGRLSEDVL